MIIRHLKAKFAAFPAWVLYLPLVILILLAILVPLNEGSTSENPTGSANAMAPILALSAIAINILSKWRRLQGSTPPWIKMVQSAGMLFSAYFWLAAEGKVNPYSTQSLSGLSLIAAVMVGATVLVLLPYLLGWILTPEPEDK